jgi:short subunit dehydrogenase-like uncharacterized protein
MSGPVLLYGATGYTGVRVAHALAGAGAPLVLAGRNAEAVRRVAEPLGVDWTAFELEDAARLDASVAGASVVLHAAGPFAQTGAPMRAACLRGGAHYLDLSGEWPGFVDALADDAAARAASVMLMPGVGLTIAATDCLLALAKQAQPDAVKLRLGVSQAQVITRGTVASAATLLGSGVVVRRGGALVSVPAGSLACAFDFGDGLREATAMSWADVVTGEVSTGVADIEVYSELPWFQRAAYRASGLAMSVTGAAPWRAAGRALASGWPEAPADASRDRAAFVMVAEAIDPWRRSRVLRMRTRDGYTVSVASATAAVMRVLRGDWSAGFQTPSKVFGADFILGLGCAWLEGASTPAEAIA